MQTKPLTIYASFLLKTIVCAKCRKEIKVPRDKSAPVHCQNCNAEYIFKPVTLVKPGSKTFKCEGCRKVGRVPKELPTKPIKCPKCKTEQLLRPLVIVEQDDKFFKCTKCEKQVAIPKKLVHKIVICMGCRTAHEIVFKAPMSRHRKNEITDLFEGLPDDDKEELDRLFKIN